MEIDILKETINVLKKDPGIDQSALKNREKAVIVVIRRTTFSERVVPSRFRSP